MSVPGWSLRGVADAEKGKKPRKCDPDEAKRHLLLKFLFSSGSITCWCVAAWICHKLASTNTIPTMCTVLNVSRRWCVRASGGEVCTCEMYVRIPEFPAHFLVEGSADPPINPYNSTGEFTCAPQQNDTAGCNATCTGLGRFCSYEGGVHACSDPCYLFTSHFAGVEDGDWNVTLQAPPGVGSATALILLGIVLYWIWGCLRKHDEKVDDLGPYARNWR